MLNEKKITFRCKIAPFTLFTPEYAHDVLAMRSHPEYEEIDAKGNHVPQPEDEIKRPLMSVDSTKTLAPSAPKRAKKAK